MKELPASGERFIPEKFDDPDLVLEHYQRYYAALPLVKGKTVLDIASGAGYGSSILAESGRQVYGVEIDQDAVDYAKEHFGAPNLQFLQGSVEKIPLPDHSVDVVVSFETIEHISAELQISMMKEIKRVLKPDGVLFISSPDKKYYSEERNFVNSFHVHELTFDEFRKLLETYFAHVKTAGQRFFRGCFMIWEDDVTGKTVSCDEMLHAWSPGLRKPHYILAIAGDQDLSEVCNSIIEYTPESDLRRSLTQGGLNARSNHMTFYFQRKAGDAFDEKNAMYVTLPAERDHLEINIDLSEKTEIYPGVFRFDFGGPGEAFVLRQWMVEMASGEKYDPLEAPGCVETHNMLFFDSSDQPGKVIIPVNDDPQLLFSFANSLGKCKNVRFVIDRLVLSDALHLLAVGWSSEKQLAEAAIRKALDERDVQEQLREKQAKLYMAVLDLCQRMKIEFAREYERRKDIWLKKCKSEHEMAPAASAGNFVCLLRRFVKRILCKLKHVHYIVRGCHEGADPEQAFREKDAQRIEYDKFVHLLASGLFDPEYYRKQYPDVAAAEIDPLTHYLNFGWKDDRRPNADFDPQRYRESNPDLQDFEGDLYRHYLMHGIVEGRFADKNICSEPLLESLLRYTGIFDPEYYLHKYPDIASSGFDAFSHYMHWGIAEHRRPSADFDPEYYLKANPDVAASGQEPVSHYLFCGVNEGRLPVGDVLEPPLPDPEALGKVVFVSHGADLTGGPLLAKNICEQMSRYGFTAAIILLSDGALRKEFEKISATRVIKDKSQLARYAKRLKEAGFEQVYLNTTVSGGCADVFKAAGFRVTTLIHEMQNVLEIMDLHDAADKTVSFSDRIIVPAREIADSWKEFGKLLPEEKTVVRPQGLYLGSPYMSVEDLSEARLQLRKKYGLPESAKIFLAVGLACWRKGTDLLLQALDGLEQALCRDVYFIWIGNCDDPTIKKPLCDKRNDPFWKEHYIFPGSVAAADLPIHYAGADALLLPSREDPFPSVVLDAMCVGIPVLAFEGTTGLNDFIRDAGNVLVHGISPEALADGIRRLVSLDEPALQRIRTAEKKLIREKFNFPDYVRFLLEDAGFDLPKVSCIVPNYRYAEFLGKRFESIIGQTYLPYELIILDDNSPDNSDEVIQKWLPVLRDRFGGRVAYVRNETNHGVFAQWREGIRRAAGDLIWIAEADDCCDPILVRTLVRKFHDPNTHLAYAQSRVINETDAVQAPDYCYYTDEFSKKKFRSDYTVPFAVELQDCLAIRNTIPNASAVIFRKKAAEQIDFDLLLKFTAAGDWLAYLMIGNGGNIAFSATPSNSHRRHSKSVIWNEQTKTFSEVKEIHKYILSHFSLPRSVRAQMESTWRPLWAKHQIPDNDIDYDCRSGAAQVRVAVALAAFTFGGGEFFAIRLANEIQREGYEVFLISAEYEQACPDVLAQVESGIRIVRMDDLREQQKADTFLADEKIALIVSAIWWADKIAWELTRHNREVQWIIAMHGCYEKLLKDRFDQEGLKLLPAMFERVDHITYSADKNFESIRSLPGKQTEKSYKVYNGFRLPAFTPADRRELGIEPDAIVLFHMARGIPEKGAKECILAVDKLRERGKKVHLLLLGESSYLTSLRNQYSACSYLHFLGFCKDAARYIAISDIGLLPSYFISESQPLTLIELFAQGKPCIATAIGEIPGMMTSGDHHAGILLPGTFEPSDPNGIANAVCDIMKDPDTFAGYKRDAVYMFEKLFSMERCAHEYLKVLSSEQKAVEQ